MKFTIITWFTLVFSVSLHAGEYYSGGKAPVPGKSPIEECLDLGGNISAGYRTDYILHGLRVNGDSVWTDVNYHFDHFLPMTFGVTHVSGIRTTFPYAGIGPIDETDLYLRAVVGEWAGFAVGLSYTHRFLNFSNAQFMNGSYGDVGVDIRKSLGFVDFVANSTLGLNSRNSFFNAGGGDGWVHRAGLEKEISLCEKSSLIMSGGVGYHDGYFYNVAGTHSWSHYYLNASLPIELNCRTTITPYVGYQGVQQWNVFFPQGDLLHSGVSLNVSF